VGVIRDLTERKRLETQLRLADRMASMGTLAAGVAHEINNPLAYVCSNLSFIKEQLAQETLSARACCPSCARWWRRRRRGRIASGPSCRT
jgi:nitrogen-specific signal transduction histidine kinase